MSVKTEVDQSWAKGLNIAEIRKDLDELGESLRAGQGNFNNHF